MQVSPCHPRSPIFATATAMPALIFAASKPGGRAGSEKSTVSGFWPTNNIRVKCFLHSFGFGHAADSVHEVPHRMPSGSFYPGLQTAQTRCHRPFKVAHLSEIGAFHIVIMKRAMATMPMSGMKNSPGAGQVTKCA